MNQLTDQLRAASQRVGPFGVIAAALMLAAFVLTLVLMVRTIAGLPWSGPSAAESLRDPTAWAERYAERVETNRQRLTGRSPFFTPAEPPPPPPPPPPPREEEEEEEENPGPPPPPPPPARYGGPEMVAMMGDVVWFANDKRLRVGEEDSGVTVVSTTPPWTAKLLWRGIEFDVQLFERTTADFLEKPPPDETD